MQCFAFQSAFSQWHKELECGNDGDQAWFLGSYGLVRGPGPEMGRLWLG